MARALRLSATGYGAHEALVHRADANSPEIRAAACGMGRARARLAARRLLAEWRPDLLIVAGVGGSLDPDLRTGELVTATAVHLEEALIHPSFIPDIAGGREGEFFSCDRVLLHPEEKSAARESRGGRPHLVEMETAGAAEAAKELRIAWAAIRVAADSSSDHLPLDFNQLRADDGDLTPWRVAVQLLRQPGALPGLMRLHRQTRHASAVLAASLATWVDSGCPGTAVPQATD